MITNEISEIRTLSTGISQFIGPHWAVAGRSCLSPRFTFNHCVPGREENLEGNAEIAANLGFTTCYKNLAEALAHKEAGLELGVIATPNHRHPIEAIAMMEAGLDVACDKPLAHNTSAARDIAIAVRETGRKLAVLPTYCCFPANLEARHRIANAGRANLVRGGTFTYHQGWLWKKLADMAPEEGYNQAKWRKIATESGEGGALGDILSHLLFQITFITGLPIVAVQFANRRFVVEGEKIVVNAETYRATDDETSVTVELLNGAQIQCHAVQYANSHRNDNSWELWLEDGSTYGWNIADHPEVLRVNNQIVAAEGFDSPIIGATNTMPAFHGEGWHDAGKRIFQWFGWELLNQYPKDIEKFPLDVLLGYNINQVIDAVVSSSSQGGARVGVDWMHSLSDIS